MATNIAALQIQAEQEKDRVVRSDHLVDVLEPQSLKPVALTDQKASAIGSLIPKMWR